MFWTNRHVTLSGSNFNLFPLVIPVEDHSFGLVEDPAELAPVLDRAIQVVKKEKRLALVDVLTQAR